MDRVLVAVSVPGEKRPAMTVARHSSGDGSDVNQFIASRDQVTYRECRPSRTSNERRGPWSHREASVPQSEEGDMTGQHTLIPRHLGPYTVGRALGSGTMGAVVQAVQTQLERAVALKVLHAGLVQDPDSVRRFLREARSIARMDHPNIVSVYDAGEIDGIYYIAMKLIEGESLKAILARTGPLTLDLTINIAIQIAGALDYAHTRGVVHLDVKPANVMVAGTGHVSLTDFGIAQALSPGATQPVTILGTPLYMSPEQIQGQEVDCRSDIYSLGLVIYEMTAGHPPFRGTCTGVMHAHVHTPVPDLQALVPSLPDDFVAVIKRALAKDPAERFQTARDLQRALERCAPTTKHEEDLERASDAEMPSAPIRDVSRAVPPAARWSRFTRHRIIPTRLGRTLASGRWGNSLAERTAVLRRRSPAQRRTVVARYVLAALVALGAAAFIFHRGAPPPAKAGGAPTATTSPVVSPSPIVKNHRNVYGSGQMVLLQWTRVPHAGLYRLQVATRPTDRAEALAYKHPFITRLVNGTSYRLNVIGSQVYYWRVQANVRGTWSSYTRSARFAVARPIIGRPLLLVPGDRATLKAAEMNLCWSRVQGAAAYRVQVTGRTPITTRSTCTRLPVLPGTYEWSVATYVRGVQLYLGQPSLHRRFTILHRRSGILRRPTPARRPSPTPIPSPVPTATPFPAPTIHVYRPPWRQYTPKVAPQRPRVTATPEAQPTPTTAPPTVFIPAPRPRPTMAPVPTPLTPRHVSPGAGVGKACDPEVEAC